MSRSKTVLDEWLEENKRLKAQLKSKPLNELERRALEHQLRSLGYIR